MAKQTVTVKNRDGIHCRPSSLILLSAQKFPDCSFRIVSDNGESNLKSILSLISLGLKCGEQVELEVEGGDADTACETLAGLFEYEFDFPKEES